MPASFAMLLPRLKGRHALAGATSRKLGRPERHTAADNAITGKVLPNLTADDLKDLGEGMVGHRRTLLDAIAYCGRRSAMSEHAENDYVQIQTAFANNASPHS
jgi:hypothetical protein